MEKTPLELQQFKEDYNRWLVQFKKLIIELFECPGCMQVGKTPDTSDHYILWYPFNGRTTYIRIILKTNPLYHEESGLEYDFVVGKEKPEDA